MHHLGEIAIRDTWFGAFAKSTRRPGGISNLTVGVCDDCFVVTVFAYEFPHRKTRDGLVNLVASGIDVEMVIGAPRRVLNLRKPILNYSAKSSALPTTLDICREFGLTYVAGDHNSPEIQNLVDYTRPKVGLILGARILSQKTIEKFSVGILNLHPGMLPDNAGLYNIEWAINQGIPQGVSAHLVNAEIDSGQLLERQVIQSLETLRRLVDLRLTLSDIEMSMTPKLIRGLISSEDLPRHSLSGQTRYHPEISRVAEVSAGAKFALYRKRYDVIYATYLSKQPKELASFTVSI